MKRTLLLTSAAITASLAFATQFTLKTIDLHDASLTRDTTRTFTFTVGETLPNGATPVLEGIQLHFDRRSQSMSNYRLNRILWQLRRIRPHEANLLWTADEAYASDTSWGTIPPYWQARDWSHLGLAHGDELELTLTVSRGDYSNFVAEIRVESAWRVSGLPLPAAFADASKITVRGLPTGLTYNPLTRRIEGVPVKGGTFTVTVSAPGVATQTFQITVEALPSWAVGTFNGTARTAALGPGVVSFSVTPLGKITGKLLLSGKTFVFSAASYQDIGEDGEYRFKAVAKAGKEAFPVAFAVYPPERGLDLPAGLSMAEGALSAPATGEAALYRSVWQDAGMAAVLAPYAGYYTAALPGDGPYGSGYLALTVDAAGNVKTVGKLADGLAAAGSGALVLDWGGRVWTTVYAAPEAYAGGALHGLAEFVARGAPAKPFVRHLDGTEAFLWESFAPTATGVPGVGFQRELELLGGWYDRLANLRDYYEGGLTIGDVDLPALQTSLKVTEWGEGTRKVSRTEAVEVEAQLDASPAGLALGVNAAGGGFLAPKADKPVLTDKATGAYDYTADTDGDGQVNTAGLAFKFAKATGLFSGTFKAWYDTVAADDLTTGLQTFKHVSATLKVGGALVPGREDPSDGLAGRGFLLVPEKVTPPAPARPYTFNRSSEFRLEE